MASSNEAAAASPDDAAGGDTAGGSTTGKSGLPFDTTMAHQARMYDYYLGGRDNYASDREAAEEWLRIYPNMASTARANRACLRRMVRYLAAEAGIRQFLDIGTGIPTANNTHQVAQAIAPESRVVYVDYDPVVLAHARALLASTEAGATEYIDADLRDTGTIITGAAELLDFTQPVAVTLLLILHVIPDSDDPWAITARLLDTMPSGSYLAITHGGVELIDPATWQELDSVAARMSQQQYKLRSHEQVMQFFEGTDLVAPGLVPTEDWRPDPAIDPEGKSMMWAGVGRKR